LIFEKGDIDIRRYMLIDLFEELLQFVITFDDGRFADFTSDVYEIVPKLWSFHETILTVSLPVYFRDWLRIYRFYIGIFACSI